MNLRYFTYQSKVHASAESLYKWHESDAAFERLVPPGQPVKLIHKDPGLEKGVKAKIRMGYPPFSLHWVAEHIACNSGRSFTDKQIKGPCTFWEHQHEMISVSEKLSILKDTITYRVPFGFDLTSKLEKLFSYRHHITSSDLYMATHFPQSATSIGVIGQDSVIKRRLLSFFHVLGHNVKVDPPFDTAIVLGNGSRIPDETNNVIHISTEPIIGEHNFRRYIRLIPSNILWPTFGLFKELKDLPIWKKSSSLPKVDIQWISLDDAIYAIYFALTQHQLNGEYLLAVPESVSLQHLYGKIRSSNPLSFSFLSPSLSIQKTCNSPSLDSVGSPQFYHNCSELIDKL